MFLQSCNSIPDQVLNRREANEKSGDISSFHEIEQGHLQIPKFQTIPSNASLPIHSISLQKENSESPFTIASKYRYL